MEFKDKAAIGIGVPLGIILMFILGAMVWINLQKKKRGPVTEVDETELEAQKKQAALDPNRAGQIQWKPY